MNLTAFDAEELLHLAANLMAQSKFAEALTCLKQAVTLQPGNAKAHLLISGAYAKTGLTLRALHAVQRAVELDDELFIGHFQYGFLLHAAGRHTEANEAWRALDRLGLDHPLVLFRIGLQALAREDYDSARHFLNRGIERNTPQGPLSAEIRQVIEWADQAQKDSESAQAQSTDADADSDAAASFLVGRYTAKALAPIKVPPMPALRGRK